MHQVDDARAWVTRRTVGIVRLMLDCQSLLEDTEGAVASADRDYAAYVGRQLVLHTLSVVSLGCGGDVDRDDAQTNFDWFAGVEPVLVTRGLGLAMEVADGRPLVLPEWLDRLRAFVADAESTLELGFSVPQIRSREDMFRALAVVRDWLETCAELGGPVAAVLPPVAGLR
jgi:hypothetical protein